MSTVTPGGAGSDTPPRLRLTDQALVAATLARTSAPAGPDGATVADLLGGLLAEPDGAAGTLLRGPAAAALALQARAATLPASAAALDVALAEAAAVALPRPVSTRDLLAGARVAGWPDVDDLLAVCGYDTPELPWGPLSGAAIDGCWAEQRGPVTETLGLAMGGHRDPSITATAARIVATVRAVAGGAVELLLAVAAAPDADGAAMLPGDAGALGSARRRLRGVGRTTGAENADLDEVLDAGRAWRSDHVLRTGDLVRAAVLAGGPGPRRLLDEVQSA